jgi:hypothetical protein
MNMQTATPPPPRAPCVIAREWLHQYVGRLFSTALEKPMEFATLAIAAISVVFLVWQLWDLGETLESQAYSYIITGLTEFDKANVENSQYREFFTQNLPLPNDHDMRLKVLALADAKLDFIDSSYTQFDHINWRHYTRKGWENYFEQSFRCSVVLRDLYCAEADEYGYRLQGFLGIKFPGMCKDKKAERYDPPQNYCAE